MLTNPTIYVIRHSYVYVVFIQTSYGINIDHLKENKVPQSLSPDWKKGEGSRILYTTLSKPEPIIHLKQKVPQSLSPDWKNGEVSRILYKT